MGPIFTTVGGAIHFAFLIQAYQASPESVLARVLRENVENVDIWTPRLKKTIDFSGLNALEVRAECAGIRAAVPRLLTETECAVIRARHGLTNYEDVDGERRFYFDRERVEAIEHLTGALASPLYPDVRTVILDLLVSRHYADKKVTPITLRQIAQTFGRSHTYYDRIATKLGKLLDLTEVRALTQMQPYFEQVCHGISLT